MLQSGLTPLHLTAQEDKVGAAEVLAKYDSNLDQQTKVWTQNSTSNHPSIFLGCRGVGGVVWSPPQLREVDGQVTSWTRSWQIL